MCNCEAKGKMDHEKSAIVSRNFGCIENDRENGNRFCFSEIEGV